jgi:hypothetical protein
MGLPLPPVIANFIMEDFEELALSRESCKPLCWFHCGDNMFVIWPNRPEKLNNFLNHLSSIHPNIHFTVEMKSDGHLPILDIDMYRRPDSSLDHALHRKSTDINLYLN